MAKTPPTQSASAMTWTTRDPIASAWEPDDAEWLWKTGKTSASNETARVTID